MSNMKFHSRREVTELLWSNNTGLCGFIVLLSGKKKHVSPAVGVVEVLQSELGLYVFSFGDNNIFF